jgi:hypothetical protein
VGRGLGAGVRGRGHRADGAPRRRRRADTGGTGQGPRPGRLRSKPATRADSAVLGRLGGLDRGAAQPVRGHLRDLAGLDRGHRPPRPALRRRRPARVGRPTRCRRATLARLRPRRRSTSRLGRPPDRRAVRPTRELRARQCARPRAHLLRPAPRPCPRPAPPGRHHNVRPRTAGWARPGARRRPHWSTDKIDRSKLSAVERMFEPWQWW